MWMCAKNQVRGGGEAARHHAGWGSGLAQSNRRVVLRYDNDCAIKFPTVDQLLESPGLRALRLRCQFAVASK